MPKKNFQQQLDIIRSQIQTVLKQFFAAKLHHAKHIDPIFEKTVAFLRDQTLGGGKRVRAALVIQGYLSVSKNVPKELYKIGAAMELIHTFLLIHDDVIDRDNLRRGKPSMRVRYQNMYQKYVDAQELSHAGNSFAILAGDIAYLWGYELFTSAKFPPTQKMQTLVEINNMIFKCGVGEILDVNLGYRKKAKEKDILKVHRYKTASYTTEGPLVVGAKLAGAKKGLVQKLRLFSKPLGVAFQIQDDILGLFGDERETGKPVGSDLRQGKQTLLILHALQNGSSKDREQIVSALGKKNITRNEIQNIRRIVYNTGSLQRSCAKVLQLIRKSKKILAETKIPTQVQHFLFNLSDYIANRSK